MSSLQTLNNNESGLIARGKINDNFTALNTDKAELSGGTFTGDISVPDEVYGVGWNGSAEVPTKNAIYDKIETLGSGSVATDAIWDAKGDLAVGTGANTASRLAVGTNGQVLTADSAEATGLKWSTPAGGGDVIKVGTPVNNQVGVWTGDGTLEGDAALTFDTATDTLTTGTVNSTTLTASQLTATDASKNIVSLSTATYPSLTETSYVKGVTSAIQTQINTKAPSASPSFTGTVTLPTGLTGVLRADSGVVSTDSDVTDLVSAASLTVAGKVELATTAEINTGTDSTRAMPVDQYVASNRNVRYFDIYAIEKATDNAVGTNIAGAIECPFTGTITEIGAYVETAGTTGASVWDVNKNGTTIMTTNKLSIDSTEVSTRTAATAPTLTTTAITAGDLITIDTDSLSTTKPKGLHVRIGIRLT